MQLWEVQEHNTRDDAWVVLGSPGRKCVYDVTQWIKYHPGGPDVLLKHVGGDATDAYVQVGHSAKADGILKKLLVGELREKDRTRPYGPVSAVDGEAPLYTPSGGDLAERLFKDVKQHYPWGHYTTALFLHLPAYLFVFVGCWLAMRNGGTLWWSVPYGWAWYCLLMIGHECIHHTMAPVTWVNQVLGYFTMDVLLVGTPTWRHSHHHIHHRITNSPTDYMTRIGDHLLEECWTLLLMVLRYVWDDLSYGFHHPWNIFHWIGLVSRFIILFSLPLAYVPCCVLSLVVFGNQLAFLAHSCSVKMPIDDLVRHQLRNSWDIFPHSQVAKFIFGGLNVHASHHVYPSLPRSLHGWASNKLKAEIPEEYRAVTTIKDFVVLFLMRHQTYTTHVSIQDVRKDLKRRAGWELFGDAGSILLFCGMGLVYHMVVGTFVYLQTADYSKHLLQVFPWEWGTTFFTHVYGDPFNALVNTEANLLIIVWVFWMHHESRALKIRHFWAHIMGGYLVGMAITVPWFIARRTYAIQYRNPAVDTSRMSSGWVLGLLVLLNVVSWPCLLLRVSPIHEQAGLVGWVVYIFAPLAYVTLSGYLDRSLRGEQIQGGQRYGKFSVVPLIFVGLLSVGLPVLKEMYIRKHYSSLWWDNLTWPYQQGPGIMHFASAMVVDLSVLATAAVVYIITEPCGVPWIHRAFLVLVAIASSPVALVMFLLHPTGPSVAQPPTTSTTTPSANKKQ